MDDGSQSLRVFKREKKRENEKETDFKFVVNNLGVGVRGSLRLD